MIPCRVGCKGADGKESTVSNNARIPSSEIVPLPICRPTRKVKVALECEDLYKCSQLLAHCLLR